jgi:putative sterol carrier protein
MPEFGTKEELYDVLDKAVAKLQESETFKQRIARADMSVGFELPDIEAAYALRLSQGAVTGVRDDTSDTTFGVTLSPATLDKLMSGKLDGESAYMSGLVRLRGNEWVAQSFVSYMGPMVMAYREVTNP